MSLKNKRVLKRNNWLCLSNRNTLKELFVSVNKQLQTVVWKRGDALCVSFAYLELNSGSFPTTNLVLFAINICDFEISAREGMAVMGRGPKKR